MKFNDMRWFTKDMVDDRFEAKLNSEAEFGWEVVSVFTIAIEGYEKSSYDRTVIVVFKRPV